MKKINLLISSYNLNYGGIERFITNLANSISSDYNVEIVSTYKLLDKSTYVISMPKYSTKGLSFTSNGNFMALAEVKDAKDIIGSDLKGKTLDETIKLITNEDVEIHNFK